MSRQQSQFQTRLHDTVTAGLTARSLPTSAPLVGDIASVTLAPLPHLEVHAKRYIERLRPRYLAAAISTGPISDDELLDIARGTGQEQGRRRALMDIRNAVDDLHFNASVRRKAHLLRSPKAAALIRSTRTARELLEVALNRDYPGEPSIIKTEKWMAGDFGFAARSTGYNDGCRETAAALTERFQSLLTIDETSTLSEDEYLDLISQARDYCDSLIKQSDVAFTTEQKYLDHSRMRYLDMALVNERQFAKALAVAAEIRGSAVSEAIAPFRPDFQRFVDWVASHSRTFDADRDTLPLAEAALTWRDQNEHANLGPYVFGRPFEELENDGPWKTTFQHVVRDTGITNLAWRDLTTSVAN